MFLIRWGFWLAVLVMLLPTDKAQQERLMQQASNATHWTLTFCDRNPATCARAGEVWTVFQAKAQFALAMAGDVLRERIGGETPSGPATAAAHAPAAAPATRRVPTLPVTITPPPAPEPREDEVLIRPVKPQDRLPLYPQQRARLDG